MWNELPAEQRNEYKRMILAFASLTEMFAQKADNPSEEDAQQSGTLSPIINSKYQETVFQKVFHASSEDIANTSYDAAIDDKQNNTKYLIGITAFDMLHIPSALLRGKIIHYTASRLPLSSSAATVSTASVIFLAILEITVTHTELPACLYNLDSAISSGSLKSAGNPCALKHSFGVIFLMPLSVSTRHTL